VLVSKLTAPTLRAIVYARFLRPDTLEAITVTLEDEEAADLRRDWDSNGLTVALTVIESPYREITHPVLKYIRDYPRRGPRDIITGVVPEYVVGHW
jgi:hypothetical protein